MLCTVTQSMTSVFTQKSNYLENNASYAHKTWQGGSIFDVEFNDMLVVEIE